MDTLGQRLRALRSAKGYGLRKAAELSGVSASTISRLERGIGIVKADTLRRLATLYGVSLTDLLGDTATEMSDEQVIAYLVGHGHNLEQLRADLIALIDTLIAEAKAMLARKGTP